MKGETVNIQWIFDKLKPYINNDELSIRVINCLYYYRYVEDLSKNNYNNKQIIQKQLRMFKAFSKKMNDIFNIINDGSFEAKGNIDQIKQKIEAREKSIYKHINQLIQPSGIQKNMKLLEKKKGKNDQQSEFDEIIGGVQNMASNAKKMSQLLAEGAMYISQAKQNQDVIYDKLVKITKSLTKMLSNPDLSLFKLIVMSAIATLLFLFTAIFILAF